MNETEFETYFTLRYGPFENTAEYYQGLTDDEIAYIWSVVGGDLKRPATLTTRKSLEIWVRINPTVQQQIMPALGRYALQQLE